jgi:MATE family multidrug resistance protein
MKLNREILRLAVPSILANITVPLVGMVDMAVAGHLGSMEGFAGAALIGGISVGTMLFDLLYWNFAFLRAGTGGLTAQAYGRQKVARQQEMADQVGHDGNDVMPGPDRASSAIERILARALRIALLSGLALIALQWVVVQGAFLVVDCTPEVRELATRYFYIRIWAAPATLSLFALKGWFIGLQDTLRPMLVDLWVNLVNILLSLGLGFGLHIGASALGTSTSGAGITLLPTLGFAGVAWGTFIAQWTGLLLALWVARKYLSISHLLKILVAKLNEDFQQNADTQQVSNHPNSAQPGTNPAQHTPNPAQPTPNQAQPAPNKAQPTEAASFFTLNRDLFLRSVGMIAVYIGFTVIGAGLGDNMLAVSSILMKLLMLFSYFTDGFAYAGEALTGRFVGERSEDGVRSTVRGTFAWGFGLAGAFILLYGLGGTPLLQLMTSDLSVVEAGRAYIPWLLLMPLIGCPAFTWDGIYIGATASQDLRNSVLLCAVGFFAVWFIGKLFVPNSPEMLLHLLMAAYFMHLAIRSLYLTGRYPRLMTQVFPPQNG